MFFERTLLASAFFSSIEQRKKNEGPVGNGKEMEKDRCDRKEDNTIEKHF